MNWYDQLHRPEVRIPSGPFARQRAEAAARSLYGPHQHLDQVGWDPRSDELIYAVTEEEL